MRNPVRFLPLVGTSCARYMSVYIRMPFASFSKRRPRHFVFLKNTAHVIGVSESAGENCGLRTRGVRGHFPGTSLLVPLDKTHLRVSC